ncbi:subunit of pyruvate dehydrogenase E1 [Ordospora colligata]|uniref:Subunit of pyruvate dehydrogenase E1 n=1 Tax=Ordospora colligata OC4 TaxID=1354746 RepID=A0A0B2UJ36_9MICR|nr:subunit of pyruvate dehydrogenase E1 [Ordospora colligata OC4]KHN69067.1 subunit of pyruvate dehydrogenase E1 [Ordospora colligata OC4]TBU14348.1 subunit of pyruvate dehydrogenase E1 [Ordospora colligata]TBU14413.1 subunit of pyruvate dehydrogenase E1 [Ordospora colligata]TBU17929.1 subunit of pyruvate dehydrogenase E1 [Ordospora colligata]
MDDAKYVHADPQESMSHIQTHLIEKSSINSIESLHVDEVVHMYKQILRIRYMEEQMIEDYKNGLIRGFCHLSIGQEAIYAALEKASKDDMVISSYRCHGIAYVTGCTIPEIMSEVLGREAGICKGKGGSMHLYNKNFFGGHGIVGAQVSLGLGIAYALKYDTFQKSSTHKVCYAFYGDGAANQGQVWESMNMAFIWKLPVVFVCENNGYGMWTPSESASADSEFFRRGNQVPGIRVTHGSTFAILSVMQYARAYALNNGPIIVQIDTHRLCTHSTADTKDYYRKNNEIQSAKAKDCVIEVGNKLLQFYSENQLQEMQQEIHDEVFKVTQSAKNSAYTPQEQLFKDILL